MKSSSSDSTEKKEKSEASREQSSLSRLFLRILVAFFILQVVIGVIVILFFIGGEMSKMQMEHIESELENRQNALDTYIDDRVALLTEYSKLPAIIAGTMHPSANRANTVDFIETLSMLDDDAFFCLQDFEGNTVYATSEVADAHRVKGEDFSPLMEGTIKRDVRVVRAGSGVGLDKLYWRLSVPVIFHDLPEGVLSAFIPMTLGPFARSNSPQAVRVAVVMNGEVLISQGEAQAPSVRLERITEYPDVSLVQEVSRKNIDERIEYLMLALVGALILGTVLFVGVFHIIGRKMLLVPHEKLQAMREDLEKEMEKQTQDLKMRTVQLSIEIRERREAEMESRENDQLVSALLEGIGAAFFIVNPETGNVIRSNEVVHDMFGLAPWQFENRTCSEIFEDFTGNVTELLCPMSGDMEPYLEGVAHHIDERPFAVARYLLPMEIKGEAHTAVIIMDITERKNLERQLGIAQKLESIGELASGIAHEINTPIQYVGDSIRFVEDAFGDVVEIMEAGDDLREKCKAAGTHSDIIEKIEELAEDADLEFVLEEIPKACSRALEGTERVAVIVRAMKNFSHPGDGQMTAVNINEALENTITVAKNEWKYVAEMVQDFDMIPHVRCLSGDINQVFLNIIVNAAHAIADILENSTDKGTITVSTREEGGRVIVRISDTGKGIAPENIEKIFDPFFTTKEVGKGTGQGLAIAHDIVVNRHGGSIDLESELGKGTTFIIGLPLDKELNGGQDETPGGDS